MSEYQITQARIHDLDIIPTIELAAAQLLEGYAPRSVLEETTSRKELLNALDQGHLWVVTSFDQPVGFAHVKVIESTTVHLEEIDVHPEHGRRGLGSRLVTTICEWAAEAGYSWVTLTTFRDVPWNMPFYRKLGFESLPAGELTQALLTIVEKEAQRGLDPTRRVVMRRACRPRHPPSH